MQIFLYPFKADDSSQTIVPGDDGTLVRYPTIGKGDTEESDGGGTMIVMSTLEGDNKKSGSNIKTSNDATSEISSNLGTMVINDNEEGDDDTMVTRSTYSYYQREANPNIVAYSPTPEYKSHINVFEFTP